MESYPENVSQNQFDNVNLPPQAVEVEMVVLGSMLLDQDAVAHAMVKLEKSYFYRQRHRIIFEAMFKLFENKTELDLVTLSNELRRSGLLEEAGGMAYLAEIANSTATAANIESHLNIIKEKALSRMLITGCTEIVERSYQQEDTIDGLLDFAEQRIFEISERRLQKGFASINPILHRTFERIDELFHSSQSGVTGVNSGYRKLNEMTAGFQKSDLIILAGRPSMGKTAFALNLARNAAVDHGLGVGIFSLEMSSEALVLRLLCTESKVDQMAVRTGRLSKDEMNLLTTHVTKLMDAPIYIDDSPGMTVVELRAKARRLKAEFNIQMLVIDYIQLMEGTRGENRQQEITHISRSIKGIAKELDIPVIALSQLSRAVESRDKSKRPQLSDLRESGAIEQDADVVMFVYRPEYYGIQEFDDTNESTHNKCEVIIGKHRNGPTGSVRLTFLKEYGKFGDSAEYYGGGPLNPSNF